MSGRFRWLTPPGPAALGLLQVEGLPPQALDRALPARGAARFARLRDAQGRLLDELVVWHLADGSCELSLHGGDGMRALVEAGLQAHGLEPAAQEPASDRWQALAATPSPAAAAWIARHGLAAPSFAADFLRRVPVVLITGGVNAGKSTLLNAWSGRDRALVSDRPGTTRDLISAQTLVGGWRLRLVDSAGLRPTSDALEAAGQELVAHARARADLVIHLAQPGIAPAVHDGDLLVLGKADLRGVIPGDAPGPAAVPVWSSLGWNGRTPEQLLSALGAAVLARLGLPAEASILPPPGASTGRSPS